MKFIERTFSLAANRSLSFSVTQEKTRMRFTMDMIRGPLHYLRAEKDSGSLLHAPQLHLVDRLQHFGIHKESHQLFEMANKSAFGTTDYFIDLANGFSYRCRPFAQDFETHAMKVVCEDRVDLGI